MTPAKNRTRGIDLMNSEQWIQIEGPPMSMPQNMYVDYGRF